MTKSTPPPTVDSSKSGTVLKEDCDSDRGAGGGGGNEGNFDKEYWRKGINHEPNNLKLQTNFF